MAEEVVEEEGLVVEDEVEEGEEGSVVGITMIA